MSSTSSVVDRGMPRPQQAPQGPGYRPREVRIRRRSARLTRLLGALLALGAVLLLTACGGKTTGTTNITSTSATLNSVGSCASGESCRWYWEYWPASGPRTASNKTSVYGPVNGPVNNIPLPQNLSGLSPNTQYRWVFCGSGSNSGGGGFFCVGPNGTPSGPTDDPPADYDIFTTLAPSIYRSTVMADNPVGYWRLADPTGTVAADETGRNPGTVNGGVLQRQQGVGPGTASMALDGSSGYISLTPATLKTANFSIETWFRTSAPINPAGIIYRYHNFGNSLAILPDGTVVGAYYLSSDPGSQKYVFSRPGLNDGLWHHAVTTGDGSVLSLLIDGVPAQQTPAAAPVYYGPDNYSSIGRDGQISEWYFPGQLQDFAYYDHALSAAQIRTHYQAMPFYGPGQLERLGDGSGCLQCPGSQGSYTRNPVNPATGNFWHTFSDVSIPGRGIPISLRRTYNSLAASIPGRFGFGWNDSNNVRLSFDGSGNATAYMEDGSQVPFPIQGGLFSPPSRVLATLVKNTIDGTYTLTREDQIKYKFSSTGQLLQQVDRNSYATNFSYPVGREVVTDPAGRTLTLTLTSGHVSSAADSTGRSVGYQYDGSGNLQQVTDVNGGLTKFTYYANHTMHTMTDPNGGVVTNVFDGSGRVTSQTDAMQRPTTFDYTTPNQTKVTDAKGNVTIERYQSNILVSRTRGFGTPQAATWTYGHDVNSIATTIITDPNGNVTTSGVDSRGNLTSRTDAMGRQTTMTYDSLNDLLTQTDPLGVTTTNVYGAGNLQSTSRPLVGTSQIATVSYQYTDGTHPGDVTVMTDADGKVWHYGYDQYGDKNLVTDPLGEKTTSTFNADGWVQTKVSPNGYAIGPTTSYTTTYDYTDQRIGGGHINGFGDIGATTDPLGRKTTVTYDANRNPTFSTDANQHTTQKIFNLNNELTEVDRADGSKVKTQYDPNGNVSSQIDGLNNPTVFIYDPLNRVSSVKDPLLRTTNYVYDGVGNLKTVTDPLNQTTTFGYDAADEKTSITYSDGTTPNVGPIHYDADGQRLDMTDVLTGTTTSTVDSLHRLTQQTNGAGSQVQYGHDLRGHVTSITYPGQTKPILRTYDDAARLKTVTDWLGTSGNTTTFNYDADSNLTSQVYPNGTTATFTPDVADQTNSIVDKQGTNTFVNLAYTRDGVGQVKSENSTGYSYNPINQLTTSGSASYGYDAADNLTLLTNGTTQQYDVANQLLTAKAPAVTTFSYDQRGNRTGITPPGGPTTTLTYDQANRLTGYGANATYAYDGDGLRMSKKVSGTTEGFTYDAGEGLPLVIQDGATSYVTGAGGLPLEQISGGTALYFHQDQLGSTMALTSQAGSVAGTAAYDAYGNTAATSGTTSPFQYAGQYKDSESGLYYLRARYYDPGTAQFISRDPLTSITRQPYSYVANNPLNFADATGLRGSGVDPTDPQYCWKLLEMIRKVNGDLSHRYYEQQRYLDMGQWLPAPFQGFGEAFYFGHREQFYNQERRLQSLVDEWNNSPCGPLPQGAADWLGRMDPIDERWASNSTDAAAAGAAVIGAGAVILGWLGQVERALAPAL
jgi:RHS repeat-associated protein